MKRQAIIYLAALSLLAAWVPGAAAFSLGVSSGLGYQNRNFKTGDLEYDLNYWGLSVQPSVSISDRWTVFVRLGYSRLVFDRPEFGASDYDEWGFEWGGGSSYSLFRWSGLYLLLEGEFSRTDTKRSLDGGGKEEGDLFLWEAGVRAGWNLKIVEPYAGFAYTGGRITHRYSSTEESFSDHYYLEDPWKPFAGARVKLPPLLNIEGRYFFGEGVLAVLNVGVSF